MTQQIQINSIIEETGNLNVINQNFTKKGIAILHVNILSINSNVTLLEVLISKLQR